MIRFWAQSFAVRIARLVAEDQLIGGVELMLCAVLPSLQCPVMIMQFSNRANDRNFCPCAV